MVTLHLLLLIKMMLEVERLRVFDVLAEDPGWVSSIHVVALNQLNYSPKGPDSSPDHQAQNKVYIKHESKTFIHRKQ